MPADARKLLAFVLYPGVTPLDVIGPLTVLRDLKVGTSYRSVTVAAGLEPVLTDSPLELAAERTFADVPAPHGVFVPGGGGSTLDAMHDSTLLSYVRSAASNADIVGATGNGALVLAAAGLLEGRRTAIHWAFADVVRSLGALPVDARWAQDGKFLTAAGGVSGIDAMLHLTAQLRSESAARLAQLWMEYDPQPPFGRPEAIAAGSTLGEQLRTWRPRAEIAARGQFDA